MPNYSTLHNTTEFSRTWPGGAGTVQSSVAGSFNRFLSVATSRFSTGCNRFFYATEPLATGCVWFGQVSRHFGLFSNRLRLQLAQKKVRNRTQPDLEALIAYLIGVWAVVGSSQPRCRRGRVGPVVARKSG